MLKFNPKYIKTFRCEKSARNDHVSQALGSFGTLGPKLSHGTLLKFADVRTSPKESLKMTLYILRIITVLKVSLFILKPSDKLLDGLREVHGVSRY